MQILRASVITIHPHRLRPRPSAAVHLPGRSPPSLSFRRNLSWKSVSSGLDLSRRFNAASRRRTTRIRPSPAAGVPIPPLDLTEENIKQVLDDAKVELAQLFDSSVGITGQVELAELDGPFVTISLRGRFWHERSTVLARIGNYLKQRIPEILEVDIEDEKMLDDSPENF